MTRLRLAVIGHVQHVTIGRVDALPVPGAIVHFERTEWIPGGGGGVAFFQLARSPAELHLFTALGDDAAGHDVRARIEATGAHVHVAPRRRPHARDVVLLTPDGERTIIVVDEPLHPRHDDALPWNVLASCDAAFYTAYDPELIRRARAARVLVVTARRAASLAKAGVEADLVVGSANDPREASRRADYPVPPRVLVMTEGARGGFVETTGGIARFEAPRLATPPIGSYGAGDTFAAALTWYVAAGVDPVEACTRAGVHAAAVLHSTEPISAHRPLARP
jgi:ribokinase